MGYACTLLTALALVLASAAPAAQTGSHVITILHTNDIHGHVASWQGWEGDLSGKFIGGFDRLAGAAQRVRDEMGADRVLLLDAGDAIGGSMVADETQGRAVLQLLRALRYDALGLGNHEPDFTPEALRASARAAGVRLLAANVKHHPSGTLLAEPFFLRSVGQVKVGVLGLAYPNTPLTTASKNVRDLEYDPDSASVVGRYLPEMRSAGAEVVVVLSHLGLSADKTLAESVQGIDVIVGGHSHNRMHQPMRVGETLIVQAGAHCSDLGRLDLTVENGRIAAASRELILLDHDKVPSDPQILQRMQTILAPLRGRLDERIGTAAAPIVRAQTLAGQEPRKRDQQSPADSLFADIIREVTDSDVALLPGVGYGVAVPAGPISAAQLRNLVPHESKVVTVELTGEQIRRILEQALENTLTDDPRRKVGGMIQVSGLRFSYAPDAEPFERLREVDLAHGALDPGRCLRVATNSMLAAGGHNYKTFLQASGRQEHGSQYAMIREWIRKRTSVRTPEDVRVIKMRQQASNAE